MAPPVCDVTNATSPSLPPSSSSGTSGVPAPGISALVAPVITGTVGLFAKTTVDAVAEKFACFKADIDTAEVEINTYLSSLENDERHLTEHEKHYSHRSRKDVRKRIKARRDNAAKCIDELNKYKAIQESSLQTAVYYVAVPGSRAKLQAIGVKAALMEKSRKESRRNREDRHEYRLKYNPDFNGDNTPDAQD